LAQVNIAAQWLVHLRTSWPAQEALPATTPGASIPMRFVNTSLVRGMVAALSIALVGSGCPCVPVTGDPPATVQQLVDQEVGALIDSNKIVGASVAIVRGDQVQKFFYGETAAGNGTPPNADTIFEIGSVTKTFTGALLALLVADGVVSLDTPIQDLLPEGVRAPSYQGQAITLRHLASHGSGLPGIPTNLIPLPLSDPYKRYTRDDLYAFLNKYTLPRAPGSAYEYSNLGMSLLGLLLELKAGTPYEQLVQERILTPLGLGDTAFALSPDQAARFAAPHEAGLLADLFCRKPGKGANWTLGEFLPAGAIKSTLDDMVAYAIANRDAATNALAPAADILYTPILTASDQVQVAIAWHIAVTPGGQELTWHNGETGGYCSFVGFDRETQTCVIILSNTIASQFTDNAAINIADALPALP